MNAPCQLLMTMAMTDSAAVHDTIIAASWTADVAGSTAAVCCRHAQYSYS